MSLPDDPDPAPVFHAHLVYGSDGGLFVVTEEPIQHHAAQTAGVDQTNYPTPVG